MAATAKVGDSLNKTLIKFESYDVSQAVPMSFAVNSFLCIDSHFFDLLPFSAGKYHGGQCGQGGSYGGHIVGSNFCTDRALWEGESDDEPFDKIISCNPTQIGNNERHSNG